MGFARRLRLTFAESPLLFLRAPEATALAYNSLSTKKETGNGGKGTKSVGGAEAKESEAAQGININNDQ